MAYPSVNAPYGFIPVNLIGGHVFAGATRQLPIQYGYPNNIFFGDFVKITPAGAAGAGLLVRAPIAAGVTNNQFTGVFLGCSYTNPQTKQKQFAQSWPAGVLAGDGMAYVSDDPLDVFKAAVCSATTVMASGSWALIGSNVAAIDNPNVPASLATGNSANAILAPAATPVTTILPFRVIGVVEDTAVPVSATGVSVGPTITLNAPGLPRAIPIGTDVSYIAANGQIVHTGSFVTVAAALGATVVTINAPTTSLGGVATPIPANATIIFTIYPELLVKSNALVQGYTSSTAV